jgi:hypothetical protein
MNARGSYLRSMTDNGGGPTLPVLRAAPVPVWPVRPLGAEFLKETVSLANSFPQTTRMSDTFESKTTLQNPTESTTKTAVDSLSISPPASATCETTTSTPIATRVRREAMEQLQPVSTVLSQIDTPQQEWLTQEKAIKPSRSETMHSVAVAQPVMPTSAAPASVSSNSSATKAMPESRQPSPEPGRTSYSSSSPETSGERSYRERPPRLDAATRFQFQLEPAPVAERASASPAAKTTAQFADSREKGAAQSRNSVHIGKIDIHIAPPPAHTAPRQIMRSVPANSSAALARGFFSSFGLRQG